MSETMLERATPAPDETALLLSVIGRAVGRRMVESLAPTGLRPRHMGAMMALRAGALSQQALAEHLGRHPTKIVALLNDLETAGLVVRSRDPEDRRRHSVRLSELGRARLAAVDVAREKVHGHLLDGVSVTQRAFLAGILARLAANLGVERPCGQVAADDACPSDAADGCPSDAADA